MAIHHNTPSPAPTPPVSLSATEYTNRAEQANTNTPTIYSTTRATRLNT